MNYDNRHRLYYNWLIITNIFNQLLLCRHNALIQLNKLKTTYISKTNQFLVKVNFYKKNIIHFNANYKQIF